MTAVQKLMSVPIFELRVCMLTLQDAQLAYKHRRPDKDVAQPRHGRRADKTITSFHKNNIFVKTRKVIGNKDVANYRCYPTP